MSTKLIVFGAEGLLGSSILSLADAQSDMAAIGLDREACDITDLDRIREITAIIRTKDKVLVNCAAYTDVDGAESHESEARAVNAVGAGNIARIAAGHGATLVHISTDYVFDGNAKAPYKENAKPAPQTVYGRTKLEGEQAVRELASRSLIVRTGWLYGHGGENFVTRVVKRGREGEVVKVVDDQIGSPTYAHDLAQVVVDLVRQKRSGVVHAVNTGQTSWYGFAARILEASGIAGVPVPITSTDLDRPANRPSYSVLDTSKLETWIENPMPSWEDALDRYLAAEAADPVELD